MAITAQDAIYVVMLFVALLAFIATIEVEAELQALLYSESVVFSEFKHRSEESDDSE